MFLLRQHLLQHGLHLGGKDARRIRMLRIQPGAKRIGIADHVHPVLAAAATGA